MEKAIEQVLEELLRKVEAGELPQKKANTVKKLHERLMAGHALSEMQEDLLREFAEAEGTD